MMSRYSRGIWRCGVSLAMGLGALCLAHTATGVEVMTRSNTATWSRLHSSSVTLSWDWDWEWVPAEAASVRVTVQGARHRQVLDQTFARGGATSTTLNVGVVTSQSEDVYTATLAFLDGGGAEVAAKTAELHALAGCFGNARVCTHRTTHRDWYRTSGVALIPYDAAWSEPTAPATNGVLSVTPTDRAPFALPFVRKSGFLPVEGNDRTELSLAFEAEGSEPLTAFVCWGYPGFMVIVF